MVSGSISPPCLGYFSPFPHGTSSLSISQKYLALPDGAGGFPQDFSCPVVLRNIAVKEKLRLRDYHPLWFSFPANSASFSITLCYALQPPNNISYQGLGCSLFARHYSGNRCCFLFHWLLRCFSSPGWPPKLGYPDTIGMGCPIRKSPDQRLFGTSPELIAAYHVLHRL